MEKPVYAVKVNRNWYIAVKRKAAEYGFKHHPTWDVWSERSTTAFLGYVGNGEPFVKLEDQDLASPDAFAPTEEHESRTSIPK